MILDREGAVHKAGEEAIAGFAELLILLLVAQHSCSAKELLFRLTF